MLTAEDICQQYADVFIPGRGNLPGTPMHIDLDPSVTTVHTPTRSVPVAKLDRVNEELKRRFVKKGLLGLLPNLQTGCLTCCLKEKKQNTVTQQRKATETGKKSEHPKQSKQRTRATPAGRTAEATSFPTKSENDRITVVVGDSIIKNLQGRKLAKAVGHRVVVKAFATIHDMKSNIIPTVERCPDQICLHIGTNDLKSKEPNVVADAIVDLAREIENSCDAEIVLSEITTRNDAHSDAVKTVNRRLKQFSRQNGWKLISHANITQNGLNKGGLHLNREGNDSLHRNFVNFLRNNN